MLDVHRLRIFVFVARLGSFTRAAAVLHMTQPTISQQVAALESELGVHLIDRNTRKMRLTASGEVLFSYGERLLKLADEALAAVRNEAGLAKQQLKLRATMVDHLVRKRCANRVGHWHRARDAKILRCHDLS